MTLLRSIECCHPSDRANAERDDYVCPDCGTVWNRYPFAEAPENIQRAFRHRDFAPSYFWSTHRAAA
jgi:transcription initiation factor TFIIIB Brf1 subunit/transcription initiation factor TFIIB